MGFGSGVNVFRSRLSLFLGIFPKSCSPNSKLSHFSVVQQNVPCKCLIPLHFFRVVEGSLLKTNVWTFFLCLLKEPRIPMSGN